MLLNAAAGLVAAGQVADLEDGLLMAGAAVDQGRADARLHELIEVSQRISDAVK